MAVEITPTRLRWKLNKIANDLKSLQKKIKEREHVKVFVQVFKARKEIALAQYELLPIKEQEKLKGLAMKEAIRKEKPQKGYKGFMQRFDLEISPLEKKIYDRFLKD